MKQLLLFIGLFITSQAAISQISYTWNGSVSTAWNTPGNWTPNGIPGAADNVTIVTGGNNCIISANQNINNITLTTGTLNMGGFVLSANGTTAAFNGGTIQNGTLTVSAATTTTFAGPVNMNCVVNITSATVTLKNTTFQNTLNITKTGATNDASSGNNVFNGAVTMTNSGSGYLMMGNGNPDQYNSTSTFNNTGSNSIYVAYNSSNNIFTGLATFNNTPTGNTAIYVAWNSAGTVFNNSIIVNSNNGQGVQFCGGNTSATASLANSQTITVGAGGFSAGTLLLRQFTQIGATAQNFNLSGTGILTFGPTSTFNGAVTSTSPSLFFNGCTFNGITNMTKTGSNGDWGVGGDVFNAVSTITNSGSAYLLLGSSSPDIWNTDVTFTDNGSDRLLPCWSSAGNQFNGNIYVNTAGSATGIQFCGGNTTSTATLAATKTIAAGSTGLTAGYLYLKQFTQLGTAAINIVATGTSVIDLGPTSSFGGPVTTTAPDIWAQGATYNSAAVFTKTGGSSNHNNQYQNIFNSTCTINQQSNGGYFMLGYNSNDLFNDNITITATGSGGIYLGWTSGTGTPTLASGKTILVGGAGFSAGFLSLNTFTQLGNAAMTLNFTGASTGLTFARSSVIGGNLTSSTPDLYLSGATFNGTVNATKTGAGNDAGAGGNTFQGAATINNSGTGYILLGNGTADTYNGVTTFNNSGSSYIAPAYNSAGNAFNNTIVVTSTNGTGVQFGSAAAASATLSAGNTIQVGAAGFSAGTLLLRQFTQAGSATINLSLTGATTLLQVGPSSSFGGDFTVVSPRILLNGAVFTDTVNLTKTGATGEWSVGGNTFNNTAIINQQGSGFFGFANGAADIYNGDLYANNNSTERIIFGNSPVGNQFNGNIILTQIGSSVGIAFGWSATTSETQASGKTISIGAAGFNTGYLQIERFTQLGSTPMNLPLTGSASLTFGPTTTIGGNLTATSGSLFFNGATFSGTVNANKTGVTGDNSNGGNIFNGITTITNSGSGQLLLANGTGDQFNTTATFNNTGSNNIYIAYNSSNNIFGGVTTFNNAPSANTAIYVSWLSAGTVFNNNIVVSSTFGQGVQFCGGNGTATASLASPNTISIGSAGFSSGTLLLRQFTQMGTASESFTLTGTGILSFGPSSSFGGNITASTPTLFFNGAIFSDSLNATKTGSTNDNSAGNNIYNGWTSITNSGSGQLLMGNGNLDQFNTTATFNNTGSNNIYVAYNSTNNVFGGVTTFNNSPTANTGIYVSWLSAGTVFNNNIVVTSTFGQGVQFSGGNGTATTTLASPYTLSIGAAGFSSGTLLLRQFTQLGAAAETFTLTGTGIMTYGPLSTFGGNVTSSSPTLFFNGATFNGTLTATKTGSTGDYSNGGNIFNGLSFITNSGSSYLLMGNTSPDIWNTDVTFTDNGSERLLPCWATTGNQFNGNIFVNTSGSATGIQFCGGNTTATATLAASKTIQAGAGGLNAGYLQLKQFTQLGNAAVNLTMSNTATYLQFGPSSAIGGNLVSSSPGLFFNGCIFSGTVTSTKTGATSDASIGNNIFNGIATMTDAGSGYLMFGNGNADQFNANATFNNTGSNSIYVAYNSTNNIFGGVTTFNNTPTANTLIYVSWNSAGTIFNNNIVVSSTFGQGVQFCGGNTTATATLAAGQTISIGAGGFTTGTLLLRQFTQVGATVQSLTLTSAGILTFGPSSFIGGNITTVSPTLFFNGCNFAGTVTSTKNGATSDGSSGNNIFNGAFVVTNTGSGYFLMGNALPDLWQSTATFNNQSTGQHMYIAYNSAGNIFNGNVVFNNQPASNGLWIYPNYNGPNTQFNGNITVQNVNGGGVYFGAGTGTATMASANTISVGAAGFNFGGLILKGFAQSGGTAQSLTTTGTSYIQYGSNASFGGPVTSSSPGLLFNGATFNGTVNCTKTGATNDQSQGNNIFNGTSTFTNNGTGYLLMTFAASDAYNANVFFVQNGTGLIYPSFNNNSNYTGNITITSPVTMTFAANAGTVTMAGTGSQTISITAGTPVPVFATFAIANTGAGVTLGNTSVNVSKSLSMISGLLNTTTTYYLTMQNGSTTAAGTATSTSYVNGPMRYQKSSVGTTTLNFPIGSGADCRPVSLTVDHATNTQYTYTAQLFDASAAGLNYTLPITVDAVSAVHYYTIGRTNAASVSQPTLDLVGNQTIQIFYGSNDVVRNGGTLTIVKNTYLATTKWIDIGGGGGPVFTGSNLTGSVTSTSTPTAFNSFSTFALGDELGGGNVLPIELLYFNAKPDVNKVDLSWATSSETNNSYFTIERSRDAANFEFVQTVPTQALNGTSDITLYYTAKDANPYPGTSYYRLSQTDLNGNVTYSKVQTVNFNSNLSVSIYPNPTTGTVYVSGINPNQSSAVVEWFDLSGRRLIQQSVQVQNGIATINVELSNGSYFLSLVTADGNTISQNVIIKK